MSEKGVKDLLELVGGRGNVKGVAHCLTRLRLTLADESLADEEAIKSHPLSKGVVRANDQFQIIIGPGAVNRVYDEFSSLVGPVDSADGDVPVDRDKRLNPLQRLVKVLGDIFIPILPAIVASGLLMGLNNLIANPGVFFEGKSVTDVYADFAGVAQMIAMIANTSFQFLPALVGWSAVKKFGGTPVMGIVLGLILINPSLMPAPAFAKNPGDVVFWNIFGLQIAQVGYQGQVIPVLCAAFILAKSERFLQRVIPDLVQMVLVAPLALLFTGFVTFLFVGPITTDFSNLIVDGILELFEFSPLVAGVLFGALVSPLVITGMHHAILGVNVQMIGSLGYCTLWPIQVMASIGQGSAALAMFFLDKDKKMRGVSLPAAISAYLGITEPAIFGVNLHYKFPFVASMIGAGCAGAIVASADVKAMSIGISGLPAPLSIMPEYWTVYLLAMAVAAGVTMVLTALFYSVVKKREQVKTI